MNDLTLLLEECNEERLIGEKNEALTEISELMRSRGLDEITRIKSYIDFMVGNVVVIPIRACKQECDERLWLYLMT